MSDQSKLSVRIASLSLEVNGQKVAEVRSFEAESTSFEVQRQLCAFVERGRAAQRAIDDAIETRALPPAPPVKRARARSPRKP